MDPGTIIAVSEIAYEGAKQAVKLVLVAVHFPKDCEELYVQLKLEQFRLQCWGRSAGLEDGKLIKALHPIYPEIRNVLDCIRALFCDLNRLREKFGIISTSVENVDEGQKELAKQWTEELQKQGLVHDGKQGNEEDVSLISKEQQDFFPVGTFKVNLKARLQWALGSKSKFRDCVAELEKHTNKLNQLLPERQGLQFQQDWRRANIIIVGRAEDEGTVSLLRNALEGRSEKESSLRGLVERKYIAAAPSTTNFLRLTRQLHMESYSVLWPSKDSDRLIATEKTTGEQVLMEKKSWNDEQTMANHSRLRWRLSRLVAMLRPGRSNYLLGALGFMEDGQANCWRIVYNIPPAIDSCQVLTLNECLSHESFENEPLERRFKLAFALASAYSELFSSGWVHKGISSHNVVYFGQQPDLTHPYVAGFEFSRQEAEESNVDAARTPAQVERSVYRHPDYIGSEASRYQVQYDIYSFGLVLMEIGYWRPLRATWRYAVGDTFGRQQALQVREWALQKTQSKFSFRVGSAYADVVSWCLKNSIESTQDGQDWHPALEFNDHVVVPLQTHSLSISSRPLTEGL